MEETCASELMRDFLCPQQGLQKAVLDVKKSSTLEMGQLKGSKKQHIIPQSRITIEEIGDSLTFISQETIFKALGIQRTASRAIMKQ